jgi:DNA-binding NarL/FixJ family response regulator
MAKNYRVLSFETADGVPAQQPETDAEIIERLRERFEILDDMTRACKKGDVRAMIVSGAPGVGKSFGVERVLGKHDLMADIANDSKLKKYEIVKGAMSAIGLYSKLYEYRQEKSILVFDDCDSVLLDDLSLNILKAALDTSKKRNIHWNTDSRLLRSEGVPNSFEFKGGAIFITNINFANVKSKKLQDHLKALESRCHYIDLTIHTEREKMLRIRQIVSDGMLEEYEFSQEQTAELVAYVDANKGRLRELSLRTVIKMADLMRTFGRDSKWQRVAQISLMK